MKIFRVFIFITAIVFAPNALAWTHGTLSYTYYADSNNGDDANNCTSYTSACKTIATVPTLTSGQSLCLVGNSYWRELYNRGTGLVSNVTISGCGGGTQPALDASDIISPSAWSKTGGLTFVYQAGPLRFPAADGFSVPVVLAFESGNFLGYKTSQALVDATPCSYTVNSHVGSTGTVYVHTCDGSSPANNGLTYEYTARAAGVFLNCTSGCYLSNTNYKRNGTTLGAIQITGDGSQPVIDGVTCTQGARHCVGIPAGTVRNSVFQDCYNPPFDGICNMLVFFENTGSGKNSYSLNNTFNFGATQTAGSIANTAGATAGYGHTGSGQQGSMNYIDTMINVSNGYSFGGIGGANTPLLTINRGTFSNISLLTGGNGTPTNVSNVTMKSSTPASVYFTSLDGGGILNILDSNICLTNINQGIFRKTDSASGSLSLIRLTTYAQATQFIQNQEVVNFGSNLTVSVFNNTFDFTNGGPNFYGLAAADGYTGNNNSFVGGTRWIVGGVTYTSLASFQSGTGQDANSVTTGSGAAACN